MYDDMQSRLVELFSRCDRHSKGYLTAQDLAAAWVGMFGYIPSKFEVDLVNQEYAIEDKELTESTFISIMTKRLQRIDKDDEIRHLFLLLDKSSVGSLSFRDFYDAAHKAIPTIPPHILESAYRQTILSSASLSTSSFSTSSSSFLHSTSSVHRRQNPPRISFRQFEAIMRK